MHLILHLGPPKTGSTSIQRALWRGGEQLQAAGSHHYRGRKPSEWSLHFLYSPHKTKLPPVLRRHFDSVAEATAWSEGCWDLLQQEVTEKRPDVTIVSSEHFANMADPAGFIDRICDGFDEVTLIAYARDPVALYVSEVDELIRGGRRFRDLPQVHGFHYNAVHNIRGFEELVGRDNLILRNFDRDTLVDGDLVADFYHVVSERTGRMVAPPELPDDAVNDSLSGAATAWLLTMNETTGMQEASTEVYRALIEDRDRAVAALRKSKELRKLPRLSMTDPVLECMLRAQADETVAWLNDGYLSTPLPRAEMPEEVPNKAGQKKRLRNWLMSYMTPQAMRAIGRALIDVG